MNISDILSDISADIRRGNESTRGYGRLGRGLGTVILFIPHLLGALVGCAVARMFQTDGNGYIYFGILFAYLGGVVKSTLMDRLSLIEGLIKNFIIMAGFGILILIASFMRKD